MNAAIQAVLIGLVLAGTPVRGPLRVAVEAGHPHQVPNRVDPLTPLHLPSVQRLPWPELDEPGFPNPGDPPSFLLDGWPMPSRDGQSGF